MRRNFAVDIRLSLRIVEPYKTPHSSSLINLEIGHQAYAGTHCTEGVMSVIVIMSSSS